MATSWVAKNDYLSTSEMNNNAEMLLATLSQMGFTFNAICAVAGNMQAESGINPGIWEGLDPYVGGYGLVQWTPYTKYSQWAGEGWQNNGQKQCERIKYEFDNGIQWSTDYEYAVDMTATQFRTSNATPETLAIAFLWNYENPQVDSQAVKQAKEAERSANARAWYNYLLPKQYVPRLSMGNIYSSVYYTTAVKQAKEAERSANARAWYNYLLPKQYVPRLSMGNIYSSVYYTTADAYYPKYQMPNCTAYVYGRWNELCDYRERHNRFPTGMGYQWYAQGLAKGFHGGTVPQLGAVACWDYMGWDDGEYTHTGHVAVVEQINYDSQGNPVSIVTSNSAWNRDTGWDEPEDRFPWFYTETILMSEINHPWDRDQIHFEGFLYNQNISPVPPTPPISLRKMPFIFYLKRHI